MKISMQGGRVALVLTMLACLVSGAKAQSTAARTAVLQGPATPGQSSKPPASASHPGLRVDYHDGYLTIDAQHTNLAEILKLVGERTGAAVDLPPGSGMEPIVEHTGPGPIKNVLEHLLNGSSFNFVIIKSPNSSDPQRILLTLQHGASTQIAPQPTPAPAQSVLWTPPDTTEKPIPLSAEADDTLVAPKESMTPDQMSEFMRQKQRELREKAQQQYPQ